MQAKQKLTYSSYWLSKLQFGSLRKPSKIGNSYSCLPLCLLIYDNEFSLHMMPKKDQYDNWQSDSRWACLSSETWDDSIGKQALCNRNLTQEGLLRSLGKEQLPIVEALVKAQPDALLTELCERFDQQTGVCVSVSTMQRAVRQLKLSVKKNINCRWTRKSTGQGFAVCLPALEFYDRPSEFSIHWWDWYSFRLNSAIWSCPSRRTPLWQRSSSQLWAQ